APKPESDPSPAVKRASSCSDSRGANFAKLTKPTRSGRLWHYGVRRSFELRAVRRGRCWRLLRTTAQVLRKPTTTGKSLPPFIYWNGRMAIGLVTPDKRVGWMR